ncbi:MAG: choice-of-anchor J domain-containing protein, partial [Rhodanobacteraceae bacterium]
PVVLYDQIANRWLISQFAGSGIPTDECIAVSTTDDATGSYNRYAFHLGSNFFDYPHLGVWPDGYYMSMNIFNSSGTTYLGPQPFVFDRAAMLAGNPATFITTGILGSSHNPILPADLDGPIQPPVGAPNPFVETPDSTYQVYGFHADFTTPANSTFNLIGSPAAAGYTQACTGGRSCVPQLNSGGTGLDGLADRLMFRLSYRNFGDHDALVGNYTVLSGGVTGIRWFELRNPTASPTVFQESTYQPDTTWRWMGSVAMDSAGNLAVGFSASSSTINPQIRYAGRLASDPLNTLGQGETHLFDGTGSQNGGLNRWGDYSDITVDPVDDCTFWYTNEYIATNGSFNWQTRIGNFRFDECGTPGFTLNVTPADLGVCAGTAANYTVNAGSISNFDSPVTLSQTGAPGSVGFTPNPITPLPGSSAMSVDTSGAGAGSYPIEVDGAASGADPRSATTNLTIYTVVPPAATLVAPANGALNQPVRPSFSWTGSNTATYTIDVATDPAFTNIVFTQDVTGTSVTAGVDLDSNTQYYWRVSSANPCGNGAVSEIFSFTTMPLPGDCSAGTSPQTVYEYGFESGLNGWSEGAGSIGFTWADNSDAHSGSHAWKADDPGTVSDQRFVSPAIDLPAAQVPVTLQFWHKRDIEPNPPDCYDGGILEISNDGGATWTQLDNSVLLTDPYNGVVSSSFGNPLAGLDAWCDVQDYTDSIVDVSSYGGQTVQFRYRLGSDSSVAHDGWYIDDVKVQSCVGGASHVVTPSVGSPSGTIAPSTPQTVSDGAAASFALTPASGFEIDNVGGTCGGTLSGNVFTTDPVTADCTVIANFVVNPVDVIFADGFEGTGGGGGGLSETFDDITTLPGEGWILQNNSDGPGSTDWFQSDGSVFDAQDGSPTGFIGANFNNTDGGASGGDGTISNWLVTPLLTFDANASLMFYTRSTLASDGVTVYPDRLEVRLCTGTPCTDVGTVSSDTGDFGTLLQSINPNLGTDDDPLGVTGYPLSAWAPFVLDTTSGLPSSGQGRIAFRYFVTSAGPSGVNSNYIGIDTVDIGAAAIVPSVPAANGGHGISPAHVSADRSR